MRPKAADVPHDVAWLTARLHEQGLLSTGQDGPAPSQETPASFWLRVWACHTIANVAMTMAGLVMVVRAHLDPADQAGHEALDCLERSMGSLGGVAGALRSWTGGDDPALPKRSAAKVTADPTALVSDGPAGTEPVWFPARVTDLVHVDGRRGHREGFCQACAEIYAAVNQAMGEIPSRGDSHRDALAGPRTE